VFRTTEEVTIARGKLAPRMLQRGEEVLLGFEQRLSGLVIRIELEGAGRGWEASGPDGEWVTIGEASDLPATTLEVPAAATAGRIDGDRLYWLRCRADSGAAFAPEDPAVSIVGATVRAVHAAGVVGESLGVSDGLPGRGHPMKHRPVLALEPGETLEVREPGSDRWEAWTPVASFARSGPGDRHFVLDEANGEIRFGPAIRQPDGGWRRYGALPPARSALRFSRYRHGGGVAGNVAAGALSMLPSPIRGVAAVTNPRPAGGGVDAEPLASARVRAGLEMRARTRAVTADDFERLTLAASRGVARAICVAAETGAAIRVHVLPRVSSAERRLTLEELTPDERLMQELAAALEERRLIGTSIQLLPPRFKGVSVAVDVRTMPLADPERVRQDITHALYVYLNPLVGGSPDGPGAGWPAGRGLNQGELFGVVHAIPGVESVNVLRMYETDVRTGAQAAQPTGGHLALAADELIASGEHIVRTGS
jgi:predicted phage baseplate assembly protein